MSLNIADKLKQIGARIDKPEQMLGKGLLQPFNNTNSASRKIMYSLHLDQILPLMNPETALVQTGYEYEFGKYASSFIQADDTYTVIAKIPKFIDNPEHHYWLVGLSDSNKVTVLERIGYEHITESYGYLNNNDYLDSLKPGSIIKKNDVVKKSLAYDKYNNRQDGINALVGYMASHLTTDDGFIVSHTAATKKFVSPLMHKVAVVVNDNDMPLNLYGDHEIDKSFPNIGEEVVNGILCAVRRHKKEECLFTQSYDRMRELLTSDDKTTVRGTVVDINVYCNNPDIVKKYNPQLSYYYQQSMDYSKRIIEVLEPIVKNPRLTRSHDLSKLYLLHKQIVSGKKWQKDSKAFSNINIEFVTIEISPLKKGDKLTDRYGGKGVVAAVIPDHLMPLTDSGERLDVIINPNSVPNRNNVGQLIEISSTFSGARINESFNDDPSYHLEECIENYCKYMSIMSPNQFRYFNSYLLNASREEKLMYLDELQKFGGFHVIMEPISESIDLMKLDELYKAFPWIKLYNVMVPITGSNGKIRMVETRRPLTIGRKYMYRLKQYAEDKFSATSLSSTNIKNEPTKSKASKNYKSPYAKTPIKFGEMEFGDMCHLNIEVVVMNLMIHSTSPHGRRLAEQLFYTNPFDIDIKLDSEAKNRNAEILNTYLKTIGLRLLYKVIPKKMHRPVTHSPVHYTVCPTRNPVKYLDDKSEPINNYTVKDERGFTKPVLHRPIKYNT